MLYREHSSFQKQTLTASGQQKIPINRSIISHLISKTISIDKCQNAPHFLIDLQNPKYFPQGISKKLNWKVLREDFKYHLRILFVRGVPPPLFGQNFRQKGGYGFGGYPRPPLYGQNPQSSIWRPPLGNTSLLTVLFYCRNRTSDKHELRRSLQDSCDWFVRQPQKFLYFSSRL